MEQAVPELDRMRAGDDLDAASAEQFANVFAGPQAEDPQRQVLGADHCELCVLDPGLGEAGLGHQGQLVDRQRPGDRARNHEGDPPKLALPQPPDHAGDRALVADAPERLGARNHRQWLGARAEQEVVVGDLFPFVGEDPAIVRFYRDDAVAVEGRPGLAGHIVQVEVDDLPGAERLADQQRPIGEHALRGVQLDLDALAGELAHGEHRLEGGDAATDDHQPRGRAAFRD